MCQYAYILVSEDCGQLREFTEKTAEKQIKQTTHHYTAKPQASYLNTSKETVPPDTETVLCLNFQTIIHSYDKMPYNVSTEKPIRPLSTIL